MSLRPSVSLPSRRLSRTFAVVAGLAPALLAAGGVGAPAGAQQPAAGAAAAVPVMVRRPAHVVRSNYVALSGDIEGSRSASIGFIVPGVVTRVGPKEGDFVRAGEEIATLDTTEYAIAVEMAAAQRERAEDEYGRAKMLFDSKGLPANDFDKAGTAVRLARAQEALARKKLADTRLVAPMSGMLARRGVEPGEQSGPGYPVFTIVEIEPVRVRVGVPETEVSRIAIGDRTTVRIPSLKGASFVGRVLLVGIAADPASRTYTAKIELANPGRVLRPGMIAEVRIDGAQSIDALTIPAEAVVRDPSGVLRVFVYDAKAKRVYGHRVTMGSAYGDEVEVKEGIGGDDLVVIGGQHRVREGSLVAARVAPAAPGVPATPGAAPKAGR